MESLKKLLLAFAVITLIPSGVEAMGSALVIKKVTRDFVSITLPEGHKNAVYKDEKRTAERLTRMLTKPSEVLKENLDTWEKYNKLMADPQIKTGDLAAHYPWTAFTECTGTCGLDRQKNPLRNELGERFQKYTKALLDNKKGDTIVYTSFGSGTSVSFADMYNLSWIASQYPGKKIHINLIDPDLKDYIAKIRQNKTDKIDMDAYIIFDRISSNLVGTLEWLKALGSDVTVNLFNNVQYYTRACAQEKGLESDIVTGIDVNSVFDTKKQEYVSVDLNKVFEDFVLLCKATPQDALIYTIIDYGTAYSLTVMHNKTAKIDQKLLQSALQGTIAPSDYSTAGVLYSKVVKISPWWWPF